MPVLSFMALPTGTFRKLSLDKSIAKHDAVAVQTIVN
jgi:hypothetical protein